MINCDRATPNTSVGLSSSSRSARRLTFVRETQSEGCAPGYIACFCTAIDSSTRNSLNSRESVTRSDLSAAFIGPCPPTYRTDDLTALYSDCGEATTNYN